MAYIKSQTRESMADILGVSPRTIYRRLNHILNTLAADIAEAATDHERTGLLHANDRTAHYKHTAK
jgi:transcriptional antiterminator